MAPGFSAGFLTGVGCALITLAPYLRLSPNKPPVPLVRGPVLRSAAVDPEREVKYVAPVAEAGPEAVSMVEFRRSVHLASQEM